MNRLLTGIIGLILSGSQVVFSDVTPVQYLAGRSEAGQPHLYWFGAAAAESTLAYDDGVSDESVYFAFSVRRDANNLPPGTFLFQDTVGLRRGTMDSGWVKTHPNIFFAADPSFWGTLPWLNQERPANPRIGEDRSGNSGRNYIGHGNSYFIWNNGGDRMIRAKVLVNNPTSEAADSFWVYRWTGSANPVHVVTTEPGQFDYLDSPPSSDNYYYQVSRWEGGLKARVPIRLTYRPHLQP